MKKATVLISCAFFFTSCSSNSGGETAHAVPQFRNLPDAWYADPFSLDMSEYWHGAGIPFGGMNYYLLPKPVGGKTWSERFNPSSRYFQAWIGAYTVTDSNGTAYGIANGELDADAIIKLGVVDQTHWLQEFAPILSPIATIDTTVPITKEAVTITGSPGWKVTCRLTTQTDTGNDNFQTELPPLLIVPKSAWEALVASYQQISLDTCLYVWHSAKSRQLNVVYYASARFKDISGASVDTGPEVSVELDAIAKSITIN
jgi:hypothetical protein